MYQTCLDFDCFSSRAQPQRLHNNSHMLPCCDAWSISWQTSLDGRLAEKPRDTDICSWHREMISAHSFSEIKYVMRRLWCCKKECCSSLLLAYCCLTADGENDLKNGKELDRLSGILRYHQGNQFALQTWRLKPTKLSNSEKNQMYKSKWTRFSIIAIVWSQLCSFFS